MQGEGKCSLSCGCVEEERKEGGREGGGSRGVSVLQQLYLIMSGWAGRERERERHTHTHTAGLIASSRWVADVRVRVAVAS